MTVREGAARLGDALRRPVSLVHPRRRTAGPEGPPLGARDAVVACGVYRQGERDPHPHGFDAALRTVRAGRDSFLWLGLYEPSEDDLAAVAATFGLHPLAVEDASQKHDRPKLERYDDTLFAVLKTIRYVDHDKVSTAAEIVETGQIMVFLGRDFVVTVRHGAHGELQTLRARLEARPQLLARGPAIVLHAIADHIVDDYLKVAGLMETDIDALENSVFDHRTRFPDAGAVYLLKREVVEFKHAVLPLAAPLRVLADPDGAAGLVPSDVRSYFRDVEDHLHRVTEQIAGFDDLLGSLLQATLAQVSVAQNQDMRKISAWVAIAAVPTATAGIYGMNFEHMPELRQVWGYPAALAFMVTVSVLLYGVFKRNGWL
ncbi:magnesium and cobalt transport protein CorA [Pseudofrankia asymbiotica]|uniref:Magnesium transporter CorA n=1 Tax=Pseudofrankia asymbiotica TaxID=1834516 RepID=A0A1V2I4Z0_9ACTN|nr:magnesium and cobalt transport protein CorA [Pseudofrankia asymbiotica]ONH25982.1 magnesium transporter CorA [Pseudofrankia asymbiotica]